MTKEEMKNRISMALKDPILQQGFEIICKDFSELEKENTELKEKLKHRNCVDCSNHASNIKLLKAKNLIEELASSLSVVGECDEEECELINKAQKFINKPIF